MYDIPEFDRIKDELFIKATSYDEDLYNMYKPVGDVVVAACIIIKTENWGEEIFEEPLCEMNDGSLYVFVDEAMLKHWNKTAEEVVEYAEFNSAVISDPPVLVDMNRYIDDPTYNGDDIDDYDFLDSPTTIVITNPKKINGATAIFYNGVAKRISEKIGGDFYIAFTSVNEAAIHDVRRMKLEDVLAGLDEVNRIDDGLFLSNYVYRYDSEKDEIILAK